MCVTIINNALLPHFHVFLWLRRVYAKKGSLVAQKHTTAKINSTSQLINGIFKALQKLLKCFSGITISVLFLPTLFAL